MARDILARRLALGHFFDPDLFADPALNILLFLFAEGEGEEGTGVTTTACCTASGVARTTALRWIKLLEGRGLIEMNDDPVDKRATMLRLSADARAACARWLEDAPLMPRTR